MSLLLKLLIILHQGTMKGLLLVSFMITPIAFLFKKLIDWQIDNSTYVLYVLGAIVIDHLLGTFYHAFWKRDFSFKANLTGLLTKLLIVVAVGFVLEGLNDLLPAMSVFKEYTITMLRVLVFLYPGGSALGNSYIMTGGRFPPKQLMERVHRFQSMTSD